MESGNLGTEVRCFIPIGRRGNSGNRELAHYALFRTIATESGNPGMLILPAYRAAERRMQDRGTRRTISNDGWGYAGFHDISSCWTRNTGLRRRDFDAVATMRWRPSTEPLVFFFGFIQLPTKEYRSLNALVQMTVEDMLFFMACRAARHTGKFWNTTRYSIRFSHSGDVHSN